MSSVDTEIHSFHLLARAMLRCESIRTLQKHVNLNLARGNACVSTFQARRDAYSLEKENRRACKGDGKALSYMNTFPFKTKSLLDRSKSCMPSIVAHASTSSLPNVTLNLLLCLSSAFKWKANCAFEAPQEGRIKLRLNSSCTCAGFTTEPRQSACDHEQGFATADLKWHSYHWTALQNSRFH